MKYKIFYLYIAFALFSSAGAVADDSSSSVEQNPAVGASSDSHSAYLSEINKLIKNSSDNTKDINQDIQDQAVYKRNQERQEKAREYYQKGVELAGEGQLDAAKEFFDKAIRIKENPEMADYTKESQLRASKQEAVAASQESVNNQQGNGDKEAVNNALDTAYNEAVDLYRQKKFHPAKDAFEHIDAIAPDYRATRTYLNIIDQDIASSETLAAKLKALEIQDQQKEEQTARAKEEEMLREQTVEKERKEEINSQAEDAYAQAIELYDNKEYLEAQKKFNQVSLIIPDFRETKKYLDRIDRDMQEEQQRLAEEKQKALQEEQWQQEEERKKQEAQKQIELEVKESQHKKDLQDQAQSLYVTAVDLFDKKSMDDASEKFKQIEDIYPDYKSTRTYIARIDQWKADQEKLQLESQKEAQAEEQRQKELAVEHEQAQEQKEKNEQTEKIYDQALDSFRDGQYEAAKDAFLKVKDIDPNFKSTQYYLDKTDYKIKEVLAEQQRQKELEIVRQKAQELKEKNDQTEKVYLEAVSLYRDHYFDTAKVAFLKVKDINPDYKSTQYYLRKIDDKISEAKAQEQRQNELEEAREQAQELKEKNDQTEKIYDQALDLYRNHQYELARDEFLKVKDINADFKSTEYYLGKIDDKIKEAQIEEQRQKELEEVREQAQELKARNDQTAKIYDHALDLYRNGQYETAKDEFLKVRDIDANFKSTQYYLGKIEDKLKGAQAEDQRQKEIAIQQESSQGAREKDDQAEKIYGQAVNLYRDGQYESAKDEFLKVKDIDANYKSTQFYLTKIDDKINEKLKEAQLEEQRQKDLEIQREQALELKEKEDQAEKIYDQALNLYRDSQYETAKDEFLKVKDIDANFKSLQYYLSKVDGKIKEAKEENLRQQELAMQREQALEKREKKDKAEKIYDQALNLYRDHQWTDSKSQFESVEQIIPDFKHTRQYLQKIDINIAKEASAKSAATTVSGSVVSSPAVIKSEAALPAPSSPVPVPLPVVTAPTQQVKPAVSLDDQQKQAQDIAALAEKSAQLYRQISDVANDRSTAQTKRKLAQVDEILNNLKENQERSLRQMREDQMRRQEQQTKAVQEEHRGEAEKMYQEGLEFLRSNQFENAKIKLLAVENIFPDYKSTRRYLSRIEEDLKKEDLEGKSDYEKSQAEHLKEVQNNENISEIDRIRKEREDQKQLEAQQQESLKELAQKASDINDEIIHLSKIQDYDSMKTKFTELEVTVNALTSLKNEMDKNKNHHEITRAQIEEDHFKAQPPSDKYHPTPSSQPSSADQYKRREIMQEQNVLFNEGVDCYARKKYTQAKLLFGELSDQHDRRAEAWLKKVDRAITRELLRSQEGEARERTAFIANQLKAQRELSKIQERERQRQKNLTEELERQKRHYEDDRLLQLRKEETLKSQAQERQRQEEKRKQLEKDNEKKQEMLRFHKIEVPVNQNPKPVSQVTQPAAPSEPVKPVLSTPVSSSKNIEQLQALSRQEQQKEIKAEEEKHRQEYLDQQAKDREEKIKKDEIIRQETQSREEFVRQEHKRQAQLEAQREAVRKQLESGVESMYKEALRLYKQGNYTAAADRFKDVQDILPGYKRSSQYMDEARLKSMNENSQAPISSDVSGESANSFSATSSAPASVSHQDTVSKALDLFDGNVK